MAAMDRNGESYLREIGTLEDKEPEVVKFKDIAEFPASLWCIFFICVAFYISIFVFIQNGSLFLSSKYGVSNVYSAFLTSIPYTISAIISPFLGFAVDKTGRWMSWVAASCLCVPHPCNTHQFSVLIHQLLQLHGVHPRALRLHQRRPPHRPHVLHRRRVRYPSFSAKPLSCFTFNLSITTAFLF